MNIFQQEPITPLQQYLAQTGQRPVSFWDRFKDNMSNWRDYSKYLVAGVVITAGVYYSYYRWNLMSMEKRKNKSKILPPHPPVMGAEKKGSANGDINKDTERNSANSVKNDRTVVSKLMVYPVKSCRGIEVESFYCGEFGPEIHTEDGVVRDRSWMVTTSNYHFLSQRRLPKMALITPSIDGDCLVVSSSDTDQPPLRIPLVPDSSATKAVVSDVWGQEITAIDCGDEAGEWFSNCLNQTGLRLLYHPETFGGRNMFENEPSNKELWKEDDKCTFADGAPYLLLSEESVEELSRRTDEVVPWLHFRPNILVRNCPPNNEDYWVKFRIGHAAFRNTKLCSRCVLTTVDPSTGTFARKDILATMKTYRTNKDKEWDDVYKSGPLMAINLGIDETGIISTGDRVVHVPSEADRL